MSDEQPTGPGITTGNGAGITIDAVTTLVHSFAMMIQSMKADILREMEKNAEQGRERWARWESEFKEYKEATDRRLELLEEANKTRDSKEHDEELVAEARIKPVKTSLYIMVHNWKTIALLIFVFLGLLGFSVETLQTLLGK